MSNQSFKIHSTAISHGILSDEYGINNQNSLREGVPTVSFPLNWENAPAGTVSFSLIFEDYDNIEDEGVCWIHWLVTNIPGGVSHLLANASRTNSDLIQGKNSWALPYGPYAGIIQDVICHYGGPAPGRPHEYECTMFALDSFLDLENGFCLNHLRKAMAGHVLAKTTLKMEYNPN